MALHDVTSDTLIVQANLVGVQPLLWFLGLGQQNQHTQWVNMLNFDNFSHITLVNAWRRIIIATKWLNSPLTICLSEKAPFVCRFLTNGMPFTYLV